MERKSCLKGTGICIHRGMKQPRAILTILAVFVFSALSAQDITFNVKSYKGGYNVSCNGSTDGSIDATIVGGTHPYTYSWSNGASTQDLSNIPAGVYTLTVTDASGSSKSKSITLYEPDLIEVAFTTSAYEGFQISSIGNSDGFINTDVTGGAPPYKYLWSDGSKKATLEHLVAGTYSVVVTDQNGCTASKTVTLYEPTPVVITWTASMHGAYNTSCFDSEDGSVDLSVSGGLPPYTYKWSNGSFNEDLSNVGADDYKVLVIDANGGKATAIISLSAPPQLQVNVTVSSFSNGYNISCPGCFNGSVTSAVNGGTAPYTYLWSSSGAANGATTANITNLGPGNYNLLITDANGCTKQTDIFLSEPAANGWDKTGNVLDNTNFLGSTNNAPLVFKTNNTEGMRIAENGNVGIGDNNPQEKLAVTGNADVNGTITARQGLKFDTNSGISLTEAPDGTKTFSYGKAGLPGLVRGTPCAAQPYAPYGHMFGGWMQIYTPNAAGAITPGTGLLNFQTWTGGSSIDASIEGNVGDGSLLINYFCGNKTLINTGDNGGDIMLTSATQNNKVGIGVVTPTEKLDVGGNIRLDNYTLFLKNDNKHGLKYTTSFGGKALDGPVLFGFAGGVLGTTNGTEKTALFWNDGGNIGIPSLAGTGTNIVQVDNNGILSVLPLSSAGVGFWSSIDGGDNIFHNTGRVGIGNNAPADLLQVGQGATRLVIGQANGDDLGFGTAYIGFNASRNGNTWTISTDDVHNGGAVIYSTIGGDLLFSTVPNNAGTANQNKSDAEILAATKLFIGSDGNVAIGTIHTDGFKFSVNGNMRAKDIIVRLTGWSDFVFEENYQRMSILDKEIFYKKEKHLPNIDKASMIETDGLQVGKTMNGMMQNIEENTLDIAELYKRLLILEKENSELKEALKNKPQQ
jgi:hypothetical protein